MARANPAFKPAPHACCPNATHLRAESFCGDWHWVLYMVGTRMPVIHCPWCSEKLPNRKTPGLSVVRGGA